MALAERNEWRLFLSRSERASRPSKPLKSIVPTRFPMTDAGVGRPVANAATKLVDRQQLSSGLSDN